MYKKNKNQSMKCSLKQQEEDTQASKGNKIISQEIGNRDLINYFLKAITFLSVN